MNCPKLKKKAEEEDRVIIYADEAGIGLLPSLHSTYAEKGVTPVLKEACKYSHASIAGAITSEGHLIYQLQQNSFDGNAIVLFLKKICKEVEKKIILIWDGAKIHFSQAVKDYLETIQDNKLWLVRLPPYSPELNASEYIWNHLKNVCLKNMCFKNITELSKKTMSKMEEIKGDSELIQSFYKHPKVGFINK
jgi:transposase